MVSIGVHRAHHHAHRRPTTAKYNRTTWSIPEALTLKILETLWFFSSKFSF
jgi:hypothetical protein